MCVTDSYRVESAGYTLKSSENEFKFMALQSRKVNSMNSYSAWRVRMRIPRLSDLISPWSAVYADLAASL